MDKRAEERAAIILGDHLDSAGGWEDLENRIAQALESYAEERYREGIEAAAKILDGYADDQIGNRQLACEIRALLPK